MGCDDGAIRGIPVSINPAPQEGGAPNPTDNAIVMLLANPYGFVWDTTLYPQD